MRRRIPVIVAAATALAAGSFGPLQSTLRVHATGAATPIKTLVFQPSPIAPAGSLGPNATTLVTVTAKDASSPTPQPIDGAVILLSFTAATNGGSATAPGAGGAPTPVTATPRAFTANSAGQVNITYKTGAATPSTGADTLVAQDPNSSTQASDSYTYSRSFAWSPNPIGAQTSIVLQATPAGATPVFIKFANPSGAAAAGVATVGATVLNNTFQMFTTDGAGQVTVSYNPSANPAQSGSDVLTAQDSATSPTGTPATDAHTYTPLVVPPVTSTRFLRSPIAKSGSLGTSASAQPLKVEGDDANGAVAGGMFSLCIGDGGISVNAAHGTAVVTDSSANPQPRAIPGCSVTPVTVTADSNGQVSVVYTAGGTATTGTDQIIAATVSPAPASSVSDFYDYAAVSSYKITGTGSACPDAGDIAAPGTLTSGSSQMLNCNVTAVDGAAGAGNPVPHTTVYMAFVPTTGGGSVTVNGVALTPQPQAFETDSAGTVGGVVYTSPASPPSGGQDVITMASDKPVVTGTVSQQIVYDHSKVNEYDFSPSPIASSGSIPAGSAPILVRVTAVNNRQGGGPIAGATVMLTFTTATGTGPGAATAAVGATKLTTTAQSFPTDGNGNVTISYTPPASVPAGGGNDTIAAVDAAINPVAAASDGYRYSAPTDFTFTPRPIAPTGTLAPGGHVSVDLAASATAYLALTSTAITPAGGSAGAATATCGAGPLVLTATPQKCVPSGGHIAIAYTASSPTPGGGNDAILASDAAGNPSFVVADTYSYVGQYGFFHSPIAPDGTLDRASHTPFTVTAYDSAFNPVGAGVQVFLSQQSSGAANGIAKVGTTALTTTPQAFPTDANGRITLDYATAATTLPNNGVDIVNAANDGSATPSLVANDGYIYGNVAEYTFNPTPVAPRGSLSPGQKAPFTLQAADASGAPVTGVHDVYLAIKQTSGGGSAAVTRSGFSPFPLTGTLTKFTTASDGSLPLTYTAPSILPVHGADLIVATDSAGSNISTVGITGYVFGIQEGYWLVASDGGIFPFGKASGFGSTGGMTLNKPIVGMTSMPDGSGYWLVASDGGIFPFGGAVNHSYGSTGGIHLNQPIVGMAVTSTGNGYWLVASDGGIFPFGDAVNHSYGSTGGIHLNQPIVGMAVTSTGNGYWLVAADGGIFPFGDAVERSYGSTGGTHLNKPIVGMAATPDGFGYWLVASDGGIFPFGDAGGFGSTGGIHLNQPIVGMAASLDGGGYWLVASDGGIFPFGDAPGLGSTGGMHLNQPIVGMAVLGG